MSQDKSFWEIINNKDGIISLLLIMLLYAQDNQGVLMRVIPH